ncbi:MAG: hypothetical protein K2M46_06725 [Lachnospiraceae bacterium]|nr:hypothetical protein [Lachnospiraceae bacterium]
MSENNKKKKEKTYTVHELYDQKNDYMLSFIEQEIKEDSMQEDIIRNISNILKNTLDNYNTEFANELKDLVDKEEYEEAVLFFEEGCQKEKVWMGKRKNMEQILTSISIIPMEKLFASPNRKRVLEGIIVAAERCVGYGKIEHVIDRYIRDYEDGLDEDFLITLWTCKANAAAQNSKRETACRYYHKVIEKGNEKGKLQPWAYRGLACMLGLDNPDGTYYEKRASEAFLLEGNIKEYITSLVGLSENIKTSEPEVALSYLDKAMKILDENNIEQGNLLASLYLRKSHIYVMLDEIKRAQEEVKSALRIHNNLGLIGNEIDKINILNSNYLFSEMMHENIDEMMYQEELKRYEKYLPQKDSVPYQLRKYLTTVLKGGNEVALEKIESEILMQQDMTLQAAYYLVRAIQTKDMENALELTEIAWNKCQDNKEDKELQACIARWMGIVYWNCREYDKALAWMEKSMKAGPYFSGTRNDYGEMLWKSEKWDQACAFFRDQVKRYGETPVLLYRLGKSLYECGQYEAAVGWLIKANKELPEQDCVQDYLNKALEACSDACSMEGKVGQLESDLYDFSGQVTVTLESFEQCLRDFCTLLKTEKRMSFWTTDHQKHKWRKFPEQHGQDLLHTFMKARFGDALEVLEEVDIGAGRMDIYLCFKNGIKTIVELKMCGGGYSSGYAMHGVEQVVHYLENKKVHVGYLLIMDGRMRDCGKGIEPQYKKENYFVRAFVADIRPEVRTQCDIPGK